MKHEEQTIHDFDLDLLCDYFTGLERQGPGSPEITLKALSFIDNLTSASRIADLGCGTGGQTMVLATRAPGQITGVDLFPRFIDLFNAGARQLGIEDRVQGLVGNMADPPFRKEELDLVWSEGAIYNIGFEHGINLWRDFLKPGGHIAVSEACWFTKERPEEIDRFWNDAYPEIDTIPHKVAQVQDAGYIPVATFVLPECCWLENFYEPQVPLQQKFLGEHAGNSAAQALVEMQRHEAALYRKYKDYYGYVFFIGKKF